MRTALDIAEGAFLAVKALGMRERKTADRCFPSRRASSGDIDGTGAQQGQEEFLGFLPLPARGVNVTSELIQKLREDEFS
jgi:hypothetical protein